MSQFRASSIMSSPDSTLSHSGLSPFGLRVVAEMNRLGMAVDVSHASDAAAAAAARASRAPVVASHSAARAVAHIARNAPDEVLKEIVRYVVNKSCRGFVSVISFQKNTGGIVMANLYSCFLVDNCNATEVTLEHVVGKEKIRKLFLDVVSYSIF